MFNNEQNIINSTSLNVILKLIAALLHRKIRAECLNAQK